MTQDDPDGGTGRCACLGYPYRRLTPHLQETYLALRDVDEDGLHPRIKFMAEFVIQNTRREVYVLEGSFWHRILAKHVAAGRIGIISRGEIFRIAFTRGNLIFLDARELASDIGKELTVYFGIRLPSVVTSRQLNVLAEHFEYLKGMADAIDKQGRASGKKFVFLSNPVYHDLVLCDALFLLTDTIDAAIKPNFYGRFSHGDTFGVVLREYQLGNLDNREYAVLVNNGDGLAAGFYGWMGGYRSCFLHSLEYYFIHGIERPLAPRRLVYQPIILWLPSCCGTGRIAPVWCKIMDYFGIAFSLSASFNDMFVPWTDQLLCHNKNRLSPFTDNGFKQHEAAVNLYNMLPHSTCMFLHMNIYRMKDIIDSTNAKVVVGIRDLRNVYATMGTVSRGGWLRYFDEEPKKLLEPLVGQWNVLPEIARSFLEIKDNPNVTFIKFEDIDKNPIEAYTRLVEKIFPDDPVYVEESLSRVIREAAIKVIPENISRYRILDDTGDALELQANPHGCAKKWEDYFTESMKDFFKANSNGFLQAFGYEKDDNW